MNPFLSETDETKFLNFVGAYAVESLWNAVAITGLMNTAWFSDLPLPPLAAFEGASESELRVFKNCFSLLLLTKMAFEETDSEALVPVAGWFGKEQFSDLLDVEKFTAMVLMGGLVLLGCPILDADGERVLFPSWVLSGRVQPYVRGVRPTEFGHQFLISALPPDRSVPTEESAGSDPSPQDATDSTQQVSV